MKIIDKLQLPDMMAMFKHEPWANALYLIWAPVIVFCIFLAKWHYHLNVLTILVGIFIGILVWTLLEYLIHRFVFHLKSDSPSIKRILITLKTQLLSL